MYTQEEYKSKLSNDFKVLNSSFLVANTRKETTGPGVLGYFDKSFPLTYEGFPEADGVSKDGKSISVNFVVVDVLSAGYARVPYFNDGSKTVVDKAAKPLSEIVRCDDQDSSWPGSSYVMCWPFTIVHGAPKDKDDRKEDAGWEIRPGMTHSARRPVSTPLF